MDKRIQVYLAYILLVISITITAWRCSDFNFLMYGLDKNIASYESHLKVKEVLDSILIKYNIEEPSNLYILTHYPKWKYDTVATVYFRLDINDSTNFNVIILNKIDSLIDSETRGMFPFDVHLQKEYSINGWVFRNVFW